MSLSDGISFFLTWGFPSALYAVVQVVAAVSLRGRWRWFSLVPVVPMAVVGALTASAYRQQSNLWPILLIFAGPAALAFVIVVWLAARRAMRSPLGDAAASGDT